MVLVAMSTSDYTFVDERDVRLYFSNFLDRCENGERFVITRDGQAIARMEPAVAAKPDRVKALAGRIIFMAEPDYDPMRYRAYLDDDQVGYVRRGRGLTIEFAREGGELLGTSDLAWGDDEGRHAHLERAKVTIATRLLRPPRYALGTRVRYELGVSSGEGVIVRLPLEGVYHQAALRYRVRHDGGTDTQYVEVGVLEHEIASVVAARG